jgi:two-component system sensor histidine kinase UhpB
VRVFREQNLGEEMPSACCDGDKSLRQLLRRLQCRAENEKRILARSLHDGLSQKLVELSINVELLDNILESNEIDFAEARKSMGCLSSVVGKLIECSVNLGDFYPRILEECGLAAALEWRLREFQKANGIKARLAATNGADRKLDRNLSFAVYRSIEELLSNISEHSEATEVQVRLSIMTETKTLGIEVRDNGTGLTAEKWNSPTSLGFLEIRERIATVNGTVFLQNNSGHGAVIFMKVPLDPASSDSFPSLRLVKSRK